VKGLTHEPVVRKRAVKQCFILKVGTARRAVRMRSSAGKGNVPWSGCGAPQPGLTGRCALATESAARSAALPMMLGVPQPQIASDFLQETF